MLHDDRASMSLPTTAGRESLAPPPAIGAAAATARDADLETAIDFILDDCFFSVGQAVGDRKKVEHAAIVWWRERYRVKFLRAMKAFGNTWLTDRSRVTAVCHLLGERAVEHAGGNPTIDLESAAQASRDVEHFCVKHAIRRNRRLGEPIDRDRPEIFAGYWCAM